MKPTEFKGMNAIIAKDQPEYLPLPAIVTPDFVITCWELSEEELEEIKKTRKLYIKHSTFGGPLQPLLPVVDLSDFITLIP